MKRVTSVVTSLPREIIIEILARVASSSANDLFTVKLSCKMFSQISEESFIYKRVLLDQFPAIAWRHRRLFSVFFDKCKSSKNPEALYRQGVIDYFCGKDLHSAVEYLKEAMESGHEGACYAMAIILLFCGADLKQKGMHYLKGIKKSRMKDCRESLRRIVRMIWVQNPIILNQRPICCTMQQKKNKGWTTYESDGDDNTCDGCKCNREIAYLCAALPH